LKKLLNIPTFGHDHLSSLAVLYMNLWLRDPNRATAGNKRRRLIGCMTEFDVLWTGWAGNSRSRGSVPKANGCLWATPFCRRPLAEHLALGVAYAIVGHFCSEVASSTFSFL
jgi:hypothetical protein